MASRVEMVLSLDKRVPLSEEAVKLINLAVEHNNLLGSLIVNSGMSDEEFHERLQKLGRLRDEINTLLL
jgi:hypothetical protein